MVLASSAISAFADNEGNLVVTANRTPQDINDVLAPIEVITRDDINRLQPESLADLLTGIAGLDVVRQGGAGQNTSIFSRGGNSNHTLVLIDGVRVGSATLGNKDLSSVSPALIERIEVVRGPRAAQWGSDAIGAVIQIFTRKLENGEFGVGVKAGSEEFTGGKFIMGLGSKDLHNTLTVSSVESEGIDVLNDGDLDGYRRISTSLRGNYKLSQASQLNWVAQGDRGNSEYDSIYGGNESDYRNYFWNLGYNYNQDALSTQINVKNSRDYLTSYGNQISRNGAPMIETRRQQLNAFSRYEFNPEFSLSAGFDYYNDEVEAATIFTETERNVSATFVAASYSANNILADISLRYDDVETIDSESSFGASVGYRFTPETMIAFSRAKGFRVPTFNDLFYPDSAFFGGNPNLVSEKSYNNEILLKHNAGNHSWLISVYENTFDNLIAFRSDANFVTRPINIASAELAGQEVVYQYRGDEWHHKVSYDLTRATDKSLDSVTNEPANTQLIRRARKHFAYTVSYDFGDVSLMAQGIYTGERPDNDFSTFPATRVSLDSYSQINLAANISVTDELTISVKISDATDEAPVNVVGYNAPGRQSFITFSYANF
nr:TonB-dependent receptor [Pleionea sp. CnH1-48]